MSAGAHTPGALEARGDAEIYGQRTSIDGSGRVIGSFMVADCKGYKAEREANATRLAACWNACQHLTLEQVTRLLERRGVDILLTESGV